MSAMQGQRQGNRLRKLRTKRGLSLAALGREIDVHESTISRWESREASMPDWRKQQLAELFGVSVPYLMRWDGEPVDNPEPEPEVAA